jgi:ABC-type multidrug transport system permease subunit
VVDKKVEETQRKLRSEFHSSTANEKEVFLNQLREEINFAQNVQRGQDQGGMLMIEIPTSGRLYRFAKTIVKDEELYITVNYVQGWIGILARVLFFATLAGIALLCRRWFVRAYLTLRQWITSHKKVFAWFQTPAGVRVLMGCAVVLFWFLAKVLFVWIVFLPAVIMIAVASTFLGLFIAVAVSEVFEAQTFSNFFRFPMIFLCGLFFPIARLPVFLRPLSYVLPLTYGADLLHGSVGSGHTMPFWLDLGMLAVFCIVLFALSLRNIKRRWIL